MRACPFYPTRHEFRGGGSLPSRVTMLVSSGFNLARPSTPRPPTRSLHHAPSPTSSPHFLSPTFASSRLLLFTLAVATAPCLTPELPPIQPWLPCRNWPFEHHVPVLHTAFHNNTIQDWHAARGACTSPSCASRLSFRAALATAVVATSAETQRRPDALQPYHIRAQSHTSLQS